MEFFGLGFKLDGGLWLKQLGILLQKEERWPCKLHA